jgi:hypothetical protein
MWRLLAFVVLIVSLGASIACGDSAAETSVATDTPQPSETNVPRTANEGGEPPIFWRTSDDFATVRVDESYKVLLRITGGYAEETISLVAVRMEDGEEIQITSNRAEPVGDDLPGSYYPTFLLLPEPGAWELTIVAGLDDATVQFDVAASAS